MIWNRVLCIALAAVCALALTPGPAGAGNNGLGNGFPSGPHYNLVILGKKVDFTCPTYAEYLEGTPDQNVIHVPQVGSEISILMESGAKGPKNDPTLAALKVTDWCSEAFDGSPAVMQLPKNADGYAVYARILGKPGPRDGSTATFDFATRDLQMVEDEFGNDLIALGVLTDTGITDFSGTSLERFDTGKKGKGAKKATDISALFQYTGDVCAINDQETFCSTPEPDSCVAGPTVCCVPVAEADGTFVEASGCSDPALAGFAACVSQVEVEGILQCPDSVAFGEDTTTNVCEVITSCKSFTEAWIFNIADFVDVLFGADNNGAYNVQVRFYPLPLINNQ